MCLRQAFKRRKQVSLVELSTKNLQNLSVRAKGYVASKKEKNELSLTCTSSRCLLPAAFPLLRQVLPYVICLRTEQEKVVLWVCHVWESTVCSWGPGGTQGESSHFCSRGARGPRWLLDFSSCQLG